jgi:chemotaxis signal transduction protein
MDNETTNNPERVWDEAVFKQSARQLQLAYAGSLEFGIFADEIAAVVSWREPAPLPESPGSVLGVVSVQGRMLTVLDLSSLPVSAATSNNQERSDPRQIIALKGDEQLALAVDQVAETIPDTAGKLLPKPDDTPSLVLGVLRRGSSLIYVLNLKELFPAAIQGRERRRRRF